MAVTTQGSGSQACTVGTEHTLLDVAVPGTFVLNLDMNPAAAGDYFEVRLYKIVITGGTRRVAYFAVFQDAQGADNAVDISVPISNALTDAGSVRATIKQVAGTGRTIDWSVEKHA